MLGFHNLTIRNKLTSIIMVISSVMLLLASAAFVGYDRYTFRRAMVQDLTVLAEIIGPTAQQRSRSKMPTPPQKFSGV